MLKIAYWYHAMQCVGYRKSPIDNQSSTFLVRRKYRRKGSFIILYLAWELCALAELPDSISLSRVSYCFYQHLNLSISLPDVRKYAYISYHSMKLVQHGLVYFIIERENKPYELYELQYQKRVSRVWISKSTSPNTVWYNYVFTGAISTRHKDNS